MKLVFSRKGFDSGSGGGPSPVLPDGTMVSLPIPDFAMHRDLRYRDIAVGKTTMAGLAAELGVKERVLRAGAHLDPDLDPTARPRRPGWRASLGQAGAAASHLVNQGVGIGDLFVFWGLYRHTVLADGELVWDRTRPAFHAIFGWLEVGEVYRPGQEATPAWAADHPHVLAPERSNNTLYVAKDQRGILGESSGLVRFSSAVVLSAPGSPRSTWRLPAGCHPQVSGAELSYHRDRCRWTSAGDAVLLRTVGRGQEFVVEATDAWLERVAAATGRG